MNVDAYCCRNISIAFQSVETFKLALLRLTAYTPRLSHEDLSISVQVAGDYKAMACDSVADCQQVLRHLGETHPTPPLWRQQRPCLHLDSAQAMFDTSEPAAQGAVVIRYMT